MRALRRQGAPASADARILGRGGFVDRLLAEVAKRTRHSLCLARPRPALETLVQRVSARAGMPDAELRAGRRTRHVSQTRRLVCPLAVRHLGYAGAAVARCLGVTSSAVNRAAWADPVPGLEAFL